MIAQGGISNGEQIVPKPWIDGIREDGDARKFGAPYNELSPAGAYRRFWWVHDVQAQTFMARGVFGQLIWIDPVNEIVMAKMSSWPDYLIPAFSRDAVNACLAITENLLAP